MKNKKLRRKKAAAGLFAGILLCAQAFGQAVPVSGGMTGGAAEKKEWRQESNTAAWTDSLLLCTAGEDLAAHLDPEDHLNLWVVDEVVTQSETSIDEPEEKCEEDTEENTEEDTEEDTKADTEEDTQEEDRSSDSEEEICLPGETEVLCDDESVERVDFVSEAVSDMEPALEDGMTSIEAETALQLEETETIEEPETEEGEDSSAALDEEEKEIEEKRQLSASKPAPVMSALSPRASEALGHDPEEDQKLVLTRVFSFWKKDLWLSPLHRDEAHVSSGGMTSTTLSLHRLGNSSDGYPYLKNYIWAYCIEPNVGSNSWTVYQNTSRDAVQLMLKIEQEAPSVYHGMIRAIAYTEYEAARLSANEAAAFRCACQTVVWQLLCGMVDGSSGERILQTGDGFVEDQLYDNIQKGALALYDNYRETNIASFTGEMVKARLEELYAYLGEYEKIPSFMAHSDQEAQEKAITMTYKEGMYQAEVTDEQGVLAQFLSSQGTLADSAVHFERKGDKVIFTSDQIPSSALKLNKNSQPSARTPAYFVYGSYSGTDRKQSLLGECNADQISAYIQFAPARKKTGILKFAEESLCPEGVRNNPNYDLNGAVFGIYDEQDVLREKITLTTDVTSLWNMPPEEEMASALKTALKEAGSEDEAVKNLAFGLSAEGYEVGEQLTLKELEAPRGFLKAPNQKLIVSEKDEKNIWRVWDEPILDPLDLRLFKKGPEGMTLSSAFLDNAEFTVRFYPEEAGPEAEKPTGECTWSGVFVTAEGGKLLLYRDYCVSGLDSFVGSINPLTGDLIFPFGWIEIQETMAPEGFQLYDQSIWIRLGEDETQTRIPEQELIRETSEGIDFINEERIWGTIQGMKTDGKLPLAGAEMMICQENGQPLSGNGRGDADFTAVVTTGEDGCFSWEGLAFGIYRIKEIKAPEGYQLSEEAQNGFVVELTPDRIEEGALVVTLEPIVNQAKNVTIRICKTLEQNENYCSLESAPWEAIHFLITGVTEAGEEIQRIVGFDQVEMGDNSSTGNASNVFESSQASDYLNQRVLLVRDLPRGTYTVSETADEALSGYQLPPSQTVDFLDPEDFALEKSVYFENVFRRYDLRVLKRSADTGENLEGSIFRLEVKDYKLDWEEDQENGTEWMEDEKGPYQWRVIEEKLCMEAAQGVLFENLLKGEYRIFETKSPYPYQLLIQNVPVRLPFPGDPGEEKETTLVLQDRAILHPVESGGSGTDQLLDLGMGLVLLSAALMMRRVLRDLH